MSFFFLMIRRPPRSTLDRSSAASDVYKRQIKDHIVSSVRIDKDDFELSPFVDEGGLGKMWKLFGEKTEDLIEELNKELAA